MREYELMAILDPTISDEDLPQSLEQVAGAVTAAGGELTETVTEAPWGRRRLAYPINDHNDGIYALCHFLLDPERAGDLDRDLKLNEQVIRFLVTRPES